MREAKFPREEEPHRTPSFRIFRHCVDRILEVMAKDGNLTGELTCFRHAAEGMAELLTDDRYKDASLEDAAFFKAVLDRGGEAAWAIVMREKKALYLGSFQKGADAAAAVLSDGSREHWDQVNVFCDGAYEMAISDRVATVQIYE